MVRDHAWGIWGESNREPFFREDFTADGFLFLVTMFFTSSDSKTTFDSEDSEIYYIAQVGLVQGKAFYAHFNWAFWRVSVFLRCALNRQLGNGFYKPRVGCRLIKILLLYWLSVNIS